MRRTGATRDTSRREQDSTSQRESGSAERTAPEEPLAALHRAGGNQAVQSLAGRERVDRAASEGVGGVSDGGEPLLRGPTADLCPRCISRYRAGKPLDCEECESALAAGAGEQAVDASTDGPAVQPKLEVSDPDDRYEREAERVAEAVMREDAGANAERGGERAPEAVQRMCSACQERSRRGKPLNCEECEAELQRATDSSGGEVDGDVAGQVRAARRGGRPLPEQTRSYLESRMGRDFGDVRVHTGTQADEAARSLNARAFTLGSDVVFRSGEYRPQTRSGKRLLAHELTHVVQQGGAAPASASAVGPVSGRSKPSTGTPGTKAGSGEGDRVQRFTIKTGGPLQVPPTDEYVGVPDEERGRVEAARDIVKRIATNPDQYPRCHRIFNRRCNTTNCLKDIYDQTELWRDTRDGVYGSDVDLGSFDEYDIGYTRSAYDIGKWTIAATMMHEWAHHIGIGHGGDFTNEDVVGACGLPTKQDINASRATSEAKNEVDDARSQATDAVAEAPDVETNGETKTYYFDGKPEQPETETFGPGKTYYFD